eukprot:755877-Hanusia_phi.AAC.4
MGLRRLMWQGGGSVDACEVEAFLPRRQAEERRWQETLREAHARSSPGVKISMVHRSSIVSLSLLCDEPSSMTSMPNKSIQACIDITLLPISSSRRFPSPSGP